MITNCNLFMGTITQLMWLRVDKDEITRKTELLMQIKVPQRHPKWSTYERIYGSRNTIRLSKKEEMLGRLHVSPEVFLE